MRSLFVKVFLWFWLALILVIFVAVLTALYFGVTPKYLGWKTTTKASLDLAGQVLQEKLARDGLPSALRCKERLEKELGIRGYILDDKGQSVRGEDVTPRMRELSRQAIQTNELQVSMSLQDETAIAARRIHGADGRLYTYISELPGFSKYPIDRSPFNESLRLGAIFGTAGLVCYWLAHSITKPVRHMRTTARRLADGDLTVRIGKAVGPRRRDEIGELARDFDFMADRIESLLASQQTLLRDISHELRSPLARLSVALELARGRAGEKAATALDRIERESERLNELIGQVLTLTRMESGVGDLPTEDVRLDVLVEEIVADARFEATQSNREVHLRSNRQCTVNGITGLLRSAIENVVRNAVRYTPEGTAVELALEVEASTEDETWAVVTVRDQGPGVPEELVNEIFRPFQRVGEARDRQTGGTGLGLAITQRAVNAHDGTVVAKNPPDGGLLVELRVPAKG